MTLRKYVELKEVQGMLVRDCLKILISCGGRGHHVGSDTGSAKAGQSGFRLLQVRGVYLSRVLRSCLEFRCYIDGDKGKVSSFPASAKSSYLRV